MLKEFVRNLKGTAFDWYRLHGSSAISAPLTPHLFLISAIAVYYLVDWMAK